MSHNVIDAIKMIRRDSYRSLKKKITMIPKRKQRARRKET